MIFKKFKNKTGVTIAMVLITAMIATGCTNTKQESSNADQNQEVTQSVNINTDSLKEKLSKENVLVVDTRSDEAFNGFKLSEDVKGGHIPGAIQFPTSWLDKVKDDKELQNLLNEKGINKDLEIVVYSDHGEESMKLLNYLKKLGYEKVYNYSFSEWSKDDKNEIVKYPNFQVLVSPQWVKDLIDGKKPETYLGNGYVLLECNYDGINIYKKGHIPTALQFDTNEIEAPPEWNVKSDAELEKVAKKFGITKDTTVIVYGNPSMGAERVALAMMYLGVEDVRVLNGGKQAWLDAGFELETKLNEPSPVNDFGTKTPKNPNYIINIPEAKEILANENGALVSVRTWDEYIGKTSGYSYFDRKGRIKGAIWCNSGNTSQDMANFEDIDGTHKSIAEVEKYYKEIGLSKDKKVSFYCGTGWRASLTFIDAYILGWKDISVFDDGWFQWSLDPENNPIEIGVPKN
ncbi:sulfurtransferase [Tepidibacter formicigenes]|jgi:thiosulfate/3-mercaptopyruvate sulfurtransferase|uniref:Thiosulfate/3-mercaptopyruvate sulfurtransferase n=1 Tax=Tepidibacter formicigenes DSM 15518 TaxID=1123349 RepID=A0A1M6JL51_9FIRM|nr:rhodanese-like domain-containing protein [Tepidibacter formicigenes]SHJ47403.1 thiosulfate/3-mercaptopyruvate sulfurtransferase [Tepidibacter formicigenes DSM 15518]